MSNIFKVSERSTWSTNNPVLLPGEVGQEAITNNVKVGDGRSRWNQLPYFASPGYWGSFWDETSQTAIANTPTAILLRSTDTNGRGVGIINQSRITVDHAGVYSFTFSIQFSNSDTVIHDVNEIGRAHV